jgi:phosphoglycolate phosphatase
VKQLLLFDIDGTLLTSGGAGEQALRGALRDRFGISDDLAGIEIAGCTDSGIARAVLERHGIAQTPEHVAAYLDGYLHRLPQELPGRPGRLLPGIVELLDALKRLPHIVLALLTGNLQRGAHIKLSHFGVWDFFEFGAFADDHHERNQLGPFARARAEERHGTQFGPESIWVIGDTPRDIACGRAIGARTVAIATGTFPAEALREHRPDFLFEDLADTARVLEVTGWARRD